MINTGEERRGKLNMKKFVKFFIAMLMLSGILIGTDQVIISTKAATTCKMSGGYNNCIFSGSAGEKIKPVYGSQALHTKGYSTQLTVSKNETTTQTSSASITATYGWSIASISASFNVANSQSKSYSAGVAYTIPASKASGRYRVITRFPGKNLIYRQYKGDTFIKKIKQIDYLPTKNAQYMALQKYQ